jgi:ABC-type lipoprotein release transport system permease subunit
MKFRPLLYTSKKFLLSKANNVKLRNVIAGVALSLVPLILVLIVSDGMIYGITQRYIELGNYHYQLKKITRPGNEVCGRA